MTDREKLIELLDNSFEEQYGRRIYLTAPHTADHLIANGVTVQRWIPVTERLPERGEIVISYLQFSKNPKLGWSDMMTDNTYNGILVGSNPRKHVWAWNGDFVTHWMPLPQPPKGE